MSVIDEIKQRLDIVDVVSDYITLQKSGRSFKALCPFHTEKTPSFFVFPERQSWHCFGSCGVGGDVFSFVIKKEGVEFGEALRILAQRAGVTIDSKQTGQAEDRAKEKAQERLYEINEAAAQYYHHLLLSAPAAETARRHLAGRGIAKEIIDSFELGFSPNSWDALCQHLEGRGYTKQEVAKAGLALAKEDGEFHDLFRNRLMIPIRNEQGSIAGFGARALDDSTPKYLNSPQTAVFDKSGILYGIDRAKRAIKEQGLAIIVEGYMDVIAAHQYGMANVVASMGTSLTSRQVGIIKRLTRNVTLALDTDAAGEQATLRGLKVALNAFSGREEDSKSQQNLKVLLMPQGKDPDEVIRENPENWRRLVEEARPLKSYFSYFFNAVISNHDLGQEAGKAAAVSELAPVISEIPDEVERELYLKELANMVGVDVNVIARKVAKFLPTKREKGKPSEKAFVSPPPTHVLGHPLEEYCLSLLLQHPELGDEGQKLSPEYFQGTENSELFLAWRASPDVESLRQNLDASLWEHLDSLVTRELPPATNKELETALADCTRRLRGQRLRMIKAMEEMLILEAASEGDKNVIKERVETILQKALEPSMQLRDLFEEEERARKGAKQ